MHVRTDLLPVVHSASHFLSAEPRTEMQRLSTPLGRHLLMMQSRTTLPAAAAAAATVPPRSSLSFLYPALFGRISDTAVITGAMFGRKNDPNRPDPFDKDPFANMKWDILRQFNKMLPEAKHTTVPKLKLMTEADITALFPEEKQRKIAQNMVNVLNTMP